MSEECIFAPEIRPPAPRTFAGAVEGYSSRSLSCYRPYTRPRRTVYALFTLFARLALTAPTRTLTIPTHCPVELSGGKLGGCRLFTLFALLARLTLTFPKATVEPPGLLTAVYSCRLMLFCC